ncbi:MAG: hypothetical protein MJ096_05785, partial [Clostridia bacterium]|nr:hypothetical protein [Clostridia bacterium]
MKKFTAILISIVIAVLLGVSAAAEGDFTITDGVLTAYTGTETDITIPEEVTHIEVGAFDACPGLTRITVTSMTCTIAPGAVPQTVTIRAYEGSDAQGVALYRDYLNFELIET